MTTPIPPRRDDLTEISDEMVQRALLRCEARGWAPPLPHIARIALAAVLPDATRDAYDRGVEAGRGDLERHERRVEREVLARCAAELRNWATYVGEWDIRERDPVLLAELFRKTADRWSRPSSPEKEKQ